MRTRSLLTMACIAVATSFGLGETASSKSVEPFSFVLGNAVFGCGVESTSPRVRDSIQFYGTGALVQHSITLHRSYDPETMRGTVTAELGASGPNNHRGTLHGVMTPEGMSGTIRMTRFREDGLTDKFVGRWFGIGNPPNPCLPPHDFGLSYTFFFEGHFIVS